MRCIFIKKYWLREKSVLFPFIYSLTVFYFLFMFVTMLTWSRYIVAYLDFGLVVCDSNNLKQINDTQGHAAGDEYIRASARLLCDSFVSDIFERADKEMYDDKQRLKN